MIRFVPVTGYLQARLQRTSYENIDEFRALLVLERLVLQPLRGWFEESLFIGLRQRFPQETEALIFEVMYGARYLDHQTAVAFRRSRSELLRLREKRLPENRERFWRERAVWIAAGGQP